MRYLFQELYENHATVRALTLPSSIDRQIIFFIRNKINSLIRISECAHAHTESSKQSRRQEEIDYLAEQVSFYGLDSRLLFHYLFLLCLLHSK